LARFNGISLPNPENFKIDFYDVEYPMTIQDQILQDDFNLKHNLTTEAHILMRDNKDLSFDDAVATIAENKEINEMLMGDFAEEPTESEKNPEEPQKEEVKPEIPEGHHMHADGTIMKDEDMK
jgi:Ran GTPase-activating protein (RanGAP) involved in mRNA processing and transport